MLTLGLPLVVGAVATQSFVDPGYGPLGLDLMRQRPKDPKLLEEILAIR